MPLSVQTHPAHKAAFGGFMAFNVMALFWLNKVKKSGYVPNWTWNEKRRLYWSYLVAVITGSCCMDAVWPIHELFLPVKAYALAFPFGLIDYFFSSNTHVSPSVLVGAGLWGSTLWLRVWLMRTFMAPNLTKIVTDPSPLSLGKEVLRFIAAAPFCSIFTDLIFSPMHRLEHRICYAQHHKQHHSFVNHINSLVLYYGAYLDDFMMPVTMTIGYFTYAKLCGWLGLGASAFSNVSEWLLLMNTLLSHAHDARCASLILPVPDSLNFAAYHRVHHLNPARNFGLTLPSDLIWDKILGVNTICLDVDQAEKEGRESAGKIEN